MLDSTFVQGKEGERGDLTLMTQRFKEVTGANDEISLYFCTEALERGLTWEHSVDYFYENQKRTDSTIKFASLGEAAEAGHAAACMKLLAVEDNGPTDEELALALYGAAANKHQEVAILLIAAYADPDHQMKDKSTVLHVAAAHGMPQVVKALLDAGACTWISNESERTPLEEAIHGGHLDVCQVFLQHRQLGHVSSIREQERFQPIRRWGSTYPGHLLPTDYVDYWMKWRLGREGDAHSLPRVHSSMEPGKVAPLLTLGHRWIVDLRGQPVDEQGYRYALDFWKFAAGKSVPASDSSTFVRYRTWVQVPQQQILHSLAEELRHRVEVKTRGLGFSNCFLGHDAVASVMDIKECSRQVALRFCEVLERSGYFHHVSNDTKFQDGKSKYRFFMDEESSLQRVDASNFKINPWMLETGDRKVKLVATSGTYGTNDEEFMQARSDFPSIVAANVVLSTGKWYYEVSVHELGSQIQVGWATVSFTGSETETLGVGDDSESWAFDSHTKKWHQNRRKDYGRSVQEGDVIGVAVDLDKHICSFSLKGSWESPMGKAYTNVAANVRPAITLQSKASVSVNFGPDFKHAPPDPSFEAVASSKLGNQNFSLDTRSLVIQNRELIIQRYPDLAPDFAHRCCIQSGDVLEHLSKERQENPDKPYLFVAYENERLVPGRGWASNHLSSMFSDPCALTDNQNNGDYMKLEESSTLKPAILPAAEWSWTTDWKTIDEDCDENGWQYATSFWSQAVMSSSSLGKCVRRRRWQRQMCAIDHQGAQVTPCISLPVVPQHGNGKSVRLRTTAGKIYETLYYRDQTLAAKSEFPSVVLSQYGEHGLQDMLLTKDKWYYEVEVLEEGHAQIGWAKANYNGFDKVAEFKSDMRLGAIAYAGFAVASIAVSSPALGPALLAGGVVVGIGAIPYARRRQRRLQEEATLKGAVSQDKQRSKIGNGVGDDDMSWSMDLGGTSWHCGGGLAFGSKVKKGDVIGCACDITNGTISYSLNGSWEPPFGNAKADLRLDAGVRPAVTVDSKAKLRLNFGEEKWSYEPPTDEFKKVMEASPCGPSTVLLETDGGSTLDGRMWGRLCSGCEKIAEPITCAEPIIEGADGMDIGDVSGRFAILHLNHAALSLHHISACMVASAVAVIIVNTDEENPEQLVDFGVYPPVSFRIPIITVSYASGRMLDRHVGRINIEMALPRTHVLEQRSAQALSSFDEMCGRIDHYRSQLQAGRLALFMDERYSCSTYLQRGIADEAKTIFMERMVDKMPLLISVTVDGSGTSLDDFQAAVRAMQSTRGEVNYSFLFGSSGTKEQCYAMLGRRGGTIFHTAPAYSLDNNHMGTLYCVLAIVLTGLVHPVEDAIGFEEVPLDYDSCELSSQGKFRIANSDQALKLFCIGFKFLPPPRMLQEYEPDTSLIDQTDWTAVVPACDDCIDGLLQNPSACKVIPEMQRVAREVNRHQQKLLDSQMQGPLDPNQLKAIIAYTHDLGKGEKAGNLYYELNAALRKRGIQNRKELKDAWGDYMHFLMTGLAALPPVQGIVYRGMEFPKKTQAVETYRMGQTVQWGAFSSTATTLDSAFHSEQSIMFKIKVHSGHDLCKYSIYASENEVLLSPECSFRIASMPYECQGGTGTMIDLEELTNEAPLFS
jgi:hypothetical protein